MTSGPSHATVAAHFEILCDLDLSAQELALQQLDPGLASRLRALLHADQFADKVLLTRPSRGAMAVLASDIANDPDPDKIGPYRIVRRIGAGAMGIVYEAEQEHPRRRVALKVLRAWLQNAHSAALFRFEAQALGQLMHPSIPVVYEAGAHDGVAYLSMELIRGLNLRTWVLQERPSLQRAASLVAAIADAVQAAHDAKLLHRDLKPSNILVCEDDRPVLLDFGVAAPLLGDIAGAQPGTPVYMSPEQARGEPIDPRSDVHALGTIAYELLTGRLPIEDGPPAAVAVAKAEPPIPAHHLVAMPRDLSDSIGRALSPSREDRTPSARAFAEDLRNAVGANPLSWKPHSWGYRWSCFRRRHRGGITAFIAIASAMLALGAIQQGWVATTERVRQSQASVHLQRVKAAMLESGRRNPAQLLGAFARQPEHAGTHAVTKGWMWWADRAPSRSERNAALAEAYLTAPSEELVRQVTRRLADAFATDADWNALWQLGESLPPEDAEELAPLLRVAAEARRDPSAIARLPGTDTKAILSLLHGQRVGHAPLAAWVDTNHDSRLELIEIQRQLGVSTSLGLGPKSLIAIPPKPGLIMPRSFTTWKDELLLLHESDTGGKVNRVVMQAEGASLEELMSLPPGRLLDVETVRTPLGPLVSVSMGFPSRQVIVIDPTISEIHQTVQTGSDAMDTLPVDLDGDGIDELVVAWGAWSAYKVELWRWTNDHYTTVASQHTGTVQELALLPRPGTSPYIIACKADIEADYQRFGTESPFGPAPGVYLLDPTRSLAIVDFLPLPIPDGPTSTPERMASSPLVGDFDGDGLTDLAMTLRYLDLRAEGLTWLVFDILGEQRSHVLAGVAPMAIADLDADGDSELLLRDDTYALWAVGAGGDPIEPWVPRLERGVELGDVPIASDPAAARIWSRSSDLAEIGLVDEAARAMQSAALLYEDPEIVAAAYHASGRLFEAGGDIDKASQAYLKSSRAAASPAASEALMRSQILGLDLDAARDSAPDAHWIHQVLPRVDLLSPQTLGAWALHHPDTFSIRDRTLWFHTFNDQGLLAELQVEVQGPVVSLQLDVELDVLELGAGLQIELVDPATDVSRELSVAFWGQGGGGVIKAQQHCADRVFKGLGRERFDHPNTQMRLSAGRLGPLGLLRCERFREGASAWAQWPSTPLAPGRYTLRIRAHGVDDYMPPSMVSGRLLSLWGTGIRPLAAPTQPTSTTASPKNAAWAAIASLDSVGLGDALARLVNEQDEQRIAWLLRGHTEHVADPLVELLGDTFAGVFRKAMDPRGRGAPPPQWRADVLRPSLDSLPTTNTDGCEVRLWRSRLWAESGATLRSIALAQTVLDGTGATPAQREEAIALGAK